MKRWKINSFEELENCISCKLANIDISVLTKDYYSKIVEIPKRNGTREICVINKSNNLYQIQKNLKKNFLDNIVLSDRAFGFVKEQSYFDYLNEHTNCFSAKYYLRIDIKDFFGSINGKHIKDALNFYVDGEEKDDIIANLQKIVLFNDKLIQGTPIAPAISNIVFRQLDIRIERYCDKCGVDYSRYADDLLFSSDKKGMLDRRFIRTIERILQSKDFNVNYDKIRLSESIIALNGFVVGEDVRLSRKKLKCISGMVYYLEKKPLIDDVTWFKEFSNNMRTFGYDEFSNKSEIINALAGNRSFIISAIRYANEGKYKERCERLIKRIEKQIEVISK